MYILYMHAILVFMDEIFQILSNFIDLLKSIESENKWLQKLKLLFKQCFLQAFKGLLKL